MARTTTHTSTTVRTTKDALNLGPLTVKRVVAIPVNTIGRNGDVVIVDDTAEASSRLASERVPTTVGLYQKIPFVASAGNFTITTASGVFTITVTTLDDMVGAIKAANIPGLTVLHEPNGNVTFQTVSATFADGTSDLPSALGIAGVVVGNVIVAMGQWVDVAGGGGSGHTIQDEGVPLTARADLNFVGAGVVASDTGGVSTITIPGGSAVTKSFTATEAVNAGNAINVWWAGAQFEARLADASIVGREAVGYVLTGAALGASAIVFFGGINTQLAGLNANETLFLSETAGVITATPPSSSGSIVQRLGKSLSDTEMIFEPAQPIKLA
jgi:hypothetical protein